MPTEPKRASSTDLHRKTGEILDDALAGKPTIIERHGRKIAVVENYEEWERLKEQDSEPDGETPD